VFLNSFCKAAFAHFPLVVQGFIPFPVEFLRLYGGEVTTKSIELLGISFIVAKQSEHIILFK
jgi:hypothetical protein